jgi:transposase InsO family protein
MTATSRSPAPIPTSISEAARRYLALPTSDAPTYPALDDIAGWLTLVEQTDRSIAQSFTDDGLPVTGDRREVAGVGTYVLRADGVPDTDSTPIYLDMHGGALIFGAGDLGRVSGCVDRHFQAAAPNRLWVADLTYVKTLQGILYLAVALDVFSRKIVGWQMSDRMIRRAVSAISGLSARSR